MKNKSTFLFALLCVMSALQVSGQSVGDYQSVATGDWSVPAVWERWDGTSWVTAPSAPTSTDGVISILSGHNISINATAVTADQIVVNTGGTLTISNILTLDDGAGVDLDANGTLVLANTIQNGVGAPQVVAHSVFNWTGGTLGSATTIAAAATFNISAANKTLAAVLDNNGTTNWSASQIAFNNGTFNNIGTFNATGTVPFNFGAGTNLFNNTATGVFNKNTSAGSVTSNIPFQNAGTININAGTLVSTGANGVFTNTGSINFTGGLGLTLSGSLAGGNALSAGTAFTGTGTLLITTATNIDLALNLPSTVTFTLSSVATVIGGSGSLVVNGTWNWNSGTISIPATVNSGATLVLAGSNTKSITDATVTNNGTINWTGFNLGFNNGTLVNNATLTATGNNNFSQVGGTNSFLNAATGTFTKNTGVAITTINIPVTNEGSIVITTGTVTITGASASFTNSGAIDFNSTTLVSSGSLGAGNNINTGTTLTGTGTLTFSTTSQINFALTTPSTITLNYSGNIQTLGGSGSLTVGGTMNWGLGTISLPVTINAGSTLNLITGARSLASTLTNGGTVTWTAGDLGFNNGSFINDGTFEAAGTGNFVITAATTNSFQNNGTFNKTSTGNTAITSVAFTNAGAINVTAGTLTKTGTNTIPFTNTGSIDIASGAVFSHISGSATGLLNLNAGTTITGSGIFRINANTAVNLALTTPATLTVEIGGVNPPITGTGSLTVNGTLNWAGGIMNIPSTIGSTGTMNSTAAKTITAPFTNNGIVNLTDPTTGNITLNNTSFTNNGTINDNFSVAARSFASAGGTNSFVNNGEYIKTSAAVTTTIAANIPVTNNSTGVFRGIGTIIFGSNPVLNNGTISPAGTTTTGILGISSNAVTGHAPTIAVNIIDGTGPGTGNDRLDMSAVTNLSGATLTATELPSAPGSPTDYIVMTAPGPNGFIGTFATVNIPATYSLAINNATNPSTVVLTKTGTLPLTWASFTATRQNNSALLKWSTFQEENTSHFEIEHSIDARTYTVVGIISAAGHSSIEEFYSFVHSSPSFGGTNFYRIKQVDLNGVYTHSRVVVLDLGNQAAAAIKAAPNPFKDQLQIIVQQEDINVTMTSSNGIMLRTWKLQPGLHNLPTENLPKGVYYLTIYQKDKRIGTQQVIKF